MRWAKLGLIVLILALGSCAPRYLTPGPAVMTPTLLPGSLIARDGTALALTVWPAKEEKAIILALHGFNDYGEAFAIPAKSFTENGISVYAIDQRGFGETPRWMRWPGDQAFLDDLSDAVIALRAQHPETPLYLMGESMGGAVALAWAGKSGAGGEGVDGLILVAPAVWGWHAMNPFYKSALWIMARIAPSMTLSGAGLDIWPSDNIEMLRAFSRDPRVIKRTRVDTLYGLVNIMDEGYQAADKVKVRTLILYGKNDQIVPKTPVLHIVDTLGGRASYAYYPKGYHMLLRDLNGGAVSGDIAAWIKDPHAPLPSGYAQRPTHLAQP
jgi:alpha-beta hydrolase superfamily lysophospholipase